jgi:hypothetical protein
VLSESRKTGKGEVMESLLGLAEICGLDFKWKGKSLKEFKKGWGDQIYF